MPINRWTILAVLFLARTCMGFQFQAIASVSPFLIDDFGIDYALIGTLIGLYKLPGIFIALPAGYLGYRFGDKTIVVVGLALMALGGAIVGVAPTYEVAVAGRTVSGVGAVLMNVMLAKMIADWFVGREIVFAMAVLVNSWPFGIALGLMVHGGLAATHSWALVQFVTVVACALALALAGLLYRAPPEADAAPPARGLRAAKTALSWREFALVGASGMVWSLFNVGLILVVSFGPALLGEQGWTITEAGWVVSLGTWLGILTVPLGGYLAERSGRPNAFVAVCLVAAALVIAAMPYSALQVLLFGAFGIVAWAPAGAIMALPAKALAAPNRSLGMGIFYTWYYLGMGTLPALAGWLHDLAGSAAAPLLFASAMMLAALVFQGAFMAVERGAR